MLEQQKHTLEMFEGGQLIGNTKRAVPKDGKRDEFDGAGDGGRQRKEK